MPGTHTGIMRLISICAAGAITGHCTVPTLPISASSSIRAGPGSSGVRSTADHDGSIGPFGQWSEAEFHITANEVTLLLDRVNARVDPAPRAQRIDQRRQLVMPGEPVDVYMSARDLTEVEVHRPAAPQPDADGELVSDVEHLRHRGQL